MNKTQFYCVRHFQRVWVSSFSSFRVFCLVVSTIIFPFSNFQGFRLPQLKKGNVFFFAFCSIFFFHQRMRRNVWTVDFMRMNRALRVESFIKSRNIASADAIHFQQQHPTKPKEKKRTKREGNKAKEEEEWENEKRWKRWRRSALIREAKESLKTIESLLTSADWLGENIRGGWTERTKERRITAQLLLSSEY